MSDGAHPASATIDVEKAPTKAHVRCAPTQLSELYRQHWSAIVGYIRRVCGPGPPDPEDAVQDAFVKYAALAERESIENPPAFLRRTARNFVIDQRRQETVRRRNQPLLAVSEENSDQIDAERVLTAKQRIEILNRVLAQMEPRKRDVFMTYKFEGLTHAELAKRFGVSPTWTKHLVAEAMIECDRAIREAEGE